MPNWIVAAHGYGERATGKLRTIFKPTQKFEFGVTVIPPGVEFVVYTHQNAIMGMDYGWDFWDALTKGSHGGEPGAYLKKLKSKKGGSIVPDYRTTGDNSFPTGVFEVCTDGNPKKVMDIDPGDSVKLSTILWRAFAAKGVDRVYWGCCTQLDGNAPMVNTRW
jgi:hypothetical protein